MVTARNLIEGGDAIGDDPREDVETSGRTFRIGGGFDIGGQRQALQQRHDINTARLKHRALAEADGVQLQFIELRLHARSRLRQETGADAIGHGSEPQIEARRLNLLIGGRFGESNFANGAHFGNGLRRENT